MKNINPKDYPIFVDMDDTLENLGWAWNEWLNKKYNLNIKIKDWTDWDLTVHHPMLTVEQIFEPLDLKEFWDTVPVKPDAQVYLKKIIDMGFPVYIVTASTYKSIIYKVEYIKKYFPYFNLDNIIFTKNKTLLKGWYLIDDGLHNFGGNYDGIIVNNPWNRNTSAFENTSALKRCNNWQEIYNYIIREYNKL